MQAQRQFTFSSRKRIQGTKRYDPKKYTLDNGVTVILDRTEGIDTAVEIMFPFGSVRERILAHFLEHTLFLSNHKQTARGMARALQGRGGEYNAFTSKDSMELRGLIPHHQATLLLETIYSGISRPRFRTEEIDIERKIIIGELNNRRSDPAYFLDEAEDAAVFVDHPLAVENETIEELRAVKREDLVRAKEQYLGSNDMVIVVCGPNRRSEMLRTLDRTFGRLPQQGNRKHIFEGHKIIRFENKYHRAGIEDSVVSVALPTPGYEYGDRRYALHLLKYLLTGEDGTYDTCSRLWWQIRQRRGLAYSVRGNVELYSGIGKMGFRAEGIEAPQHTRTIREIILEELEKLATDEVTEEEFVSARESFLVKMYRDTAPTPDRAEGLVTAEFYGVEGGFEYARRRVMKLTQRDLLVEARRQFDGGYFIGTLTPR